MDLKVCKYCGREFDARHGERAGGWDTCSEKCRIKTDKAIKKGDMFVATTDSGSGCGTVIGVVFWIGVILYGITHWIH